MTRVRVFALIVVLGACRRPLAPGETRCMTIGNATQCKTGQPVDGGGRGDASER